VELTEKAVGIYRGHFLPTDAKEPWAISLRERFRAKFMQCINSLGSCWMEGGRYDKAIQVFMNGLEIDDLAEEFYQYLMVCYNQLGQQAEAVKVYRRCRSVLESSLGLKPSSKTESIYYAIRQGKWYFMQFCWVIVTDVTFFYAVFRHLDHFYLKIITILTHL